MRPIPLHGSRRLKILPHQPVNPVKTGSMNKKIIIAALLVLGAAAVFEFHPAVRAAQAFVARADYENADVSCQALLQGRPWQGRVNYWFFAWVFLTPLLIFSVAPHASAWMRGGRAALAAMACYALMNLAVRLQWGMRNAPFMQDPFYPDALNGWRMDCLNLAGDGFSQTIALSLGWVPACLYTGLCLLAWNFFHRRISKQIAAGPYKDDMATRALRVFMRVYGVVVLLYFFSLAAFILASYLMSEPHFHPGYMGMMALFITRPLFIPIEIFSY